MKKKLEFQKLAIFKMKSQVTRHSVDPIERLHCTAKSGRFSNDALKSASDWLFFQEPQFDWLRASPS